MSVLRETIRRLLLENNDHYEKLAVMLCSGDRSQIVQAIELAKTMDYVHRVEYNTFGLVDGEGLVHRWNFSVVRPFEPVILDEFDKRDYDPDFAIYPARNHSIGIKLVEEQ